MRTSIASRKSAHNATRAPPKLSKTFSDDVGVSSDSDSSQSSIIRLDHSHRYSFSRQDTCPLPPPPFRARQVWAPEDLRPRHSYRFIGNDFLHELRKRGGGITYAKGDGFQQAYFLDDEEFFRFNLVPIELVPPQVENFTTEISGSWVSRQALDLLQYRYTESNAGCFVIDRNMHFVRFLSFPKEYEIVALTLDFSMRLKRWLCFPIEVLPVACKSAQEMSFKSAVCARRSMLRLTGW